MSYQVATLVWVLLIIATIISACSAIGSVGYGFEAGSVKALVVGVFLIFLTAILGWGIWIVYPMSAAGIS